MLVTQAGSAVERSPRWIGRLADVPTLIAISIVAWALVDVVHELVGHGGAGILVGYPVQAVSTTTAHLAVDWGAVIRTQGPALVNVTLAGGTAANLVTGAIALIALGWRGGIDGATRCFLWLFASFSGVLAAANLGTAVLVGVGDWSQIIALSGAGEGWRLLVLASGACVAVVGYALPLRLWLPRLSGRRLTQLMLTALPVGTAAVVQTLSVLAGPFAYLPPESNHLLASTFVLAHLVLWAALVNALPVPRVGDFSAPALLPRSNTWLGVGLVVLVLFVAVLGPGIGSFSGHPALG
jgi:hypothetical protein